MSDSQNGFQILTPAGDALPHLSEDPPHVRAFDLSPDGRRLVMSRGGGGSNSTECWDIRPSGAFALLWAQCDGTPFDPVQTPWCRSRWSIDGVALSPDGKRVLVAEDRTSASRFPSIVLRDAKNGRELADLGRSKGSFATRLRFAANGKAAFACDDALLERWDIAKKSCSHTAAAPPNRRMVAFAVGKHGVFTAAGKNIYRWNPDDLTLEDTLSPDIGKVHSLAIGARGKRIAAGGDKGQIAVWDL